jgi:hypothetical protein
MRKRCLKIVDHKVQSKISQQPCRFLFCPRLRRPLVLSSTVSCPFLQIHQTTSLTIPSPRQRWPCRSRLANGYLSEPDSAAQYACGDYRLPRLRPLLWLSHRSRSDRRRHRSRQLGNKRRWNPTRAHRTPRPKSRNSSLERRRTELRRPNSRADPKNQRRFFAAAR